jgi:hypothetical protein
MANVSVQISANSTPALLWQTTTGVSPDHAVDSANQYFRACTVNDPLPIVVENQGANAFYVGGSGANSTTGTEIAAGGSLTFNVVGNDSLYGVCASAQTTTIGVSVGRQ